MEFSYKIFTTPDRDWYILSICYGVGTKNATIEKIISSENRLTGYSLRFSNTIEDANAKMSIII